MKSHITVRSWGALLIGAFFGIVTARTIFDDVLNGASIKTAHLQSLAAIVGAIASGHMLLPVLKQAKIAAFLGMALIFAASTGYVVISAGARNAEISAAKALSATSTNDERQAAISKAEQAEAELAEAKTARDAATSAAAKECRSGDGAKCKGKTKTADAAAVELDKAKGFAILMRAKVDVLKPVVKAHAGYAHAATVLAALPGVTASADSIQARVELLLPFAVVLISEIGCLTFLGLAVGHRGASPETSRTPEIPVRKGKSGNTPPRGTRKKTGRPSDQDVINFVESFRTKHGRPPSGTEIRNQFPDLPKSTAFDHAARARIVPQFRAVA